VRDHGDRVSTFLSDSQREHLKRFLRFQRWRARTVEPRDVKHLIYLDPDFVIAKYVAWLEAGEPDGLSASEGSRESSTDGWRPDGES
jgi:hypothetical protein